ncbi:hypothetical protein CEP52_000727 [Fusarium oligoseptatum]|uniref:Uncharacterized protein n=1 Tax=Fusarium oligoseptatum TaxID=2604345 RepID=A0A428UMQ1_9HYPO|nr:hypothetical protein CEP52_000727 [Fusarium oligoseptatum]
MQQQDVSRSPKPLPHLLLRGNFGTAPLSEQQWDGMNVQISTQSTLKIAARVKREAAQLPRARRRHFGAHRSISPARFDNGKAKFGEMVATECPGSENASLIPARETPRTTQPCKLGRGRVSGAVLSRGSVSNNTTMMVMMGNEQRYETKFGIGIGES